jgi:hypothetical protein
VQNVTLHRAIGTLICGWLSLQPAIADVIGEKGDSAQSPEHGENQEDNEPPAHTPYWYVGEEDYWHRLLSGGYARQWDPDHGALAGPTISWGCWMEGEVTGGFSVWLTSVAGGDQRVTTAGVEMLGPVTFPIGPVLILTTVRIGLENRQAPPHDGFGGLAALGLETGVWLSKHWQVALRAERELAFPSADRNQVVLQLRWRSARSLRSPKP